MNTDEIHKELAKCGIGVMRDENISACGNHKIHLKSVGYLTAYR